MFFRIFVNLVPKLLIMDTAIFITGIVVSAIISALCSEAILRGVAMALSKVDLPRRSTFEGTWEATFTMAGEDGVAKSYSEKIKLVKRLGTYYGYNVPDSNNHELLKTVDAQKPMRLRGTIVDNRYFTGVWFHPSNQSRFHGAYQLLLGLSGESMEGVWTGFSESRNGIEAGSWTWKKND